MLDAVDGNWVVVFVDMWDSTHSKPYLNPHGNGAKELTDRSVAAHNSAMIKSFREVVASKDRGSDHKVRAHLFKPLGDGALFLFDYAHLELAVVFAAYFVERLRAEHPEVQTGIAMASGEVTFVGEPFAPGHDGADDAPAAPTDVAGKPDDAAGGPVQTASAAPTDVAGKADDAAGRPVQIASPATMDVAGKPVDVAARLVQIASGNQILLSEEFARDMQGPKREAIDSLWLECRRRADDITLGDVTRVTLPASVERPRISCEVRELLIGKNATPVRNDRVFWSQLMELLNELTGALLEAWDGDLASLDTGISKQIATQLNDNQIKKIKRVVKRFATDSAPLRLVARIEKSEELRRLPEIQDFANNVRSTVDELTKHVFADGTLNSLRRSTDEQRQNWHEDLNTRYTGPLTDELNELQLLIDDIIKGNDYPSRRVLLRAGEGDAR